MTWFKKKEKQPENKYQRLLGFYSEMIVSKPKILKELISEGKEILALENYSYQISDYSTVAMMQWRHGDDPRSTIEDMYQAYEKLLQYRLNIDPQHEITMRQFTGTTDWDMVYLMFWLNGRNVPVTLYNALDVWDRYYDYSRYLTCLITNNVPTQDLKVKVIELSEGNSDLVDRNFIDVLKVLGELETTDTNEQIIQRLETNWLKRKNSSYYRKVSPSMAGSDDSNDLSLDFHLAAALKKKKISTTSIHKWLWD